MTAGSGSGGNGGSISLVAGYGGPHSGNGGDSTIASGSGRQDGGTVKLRAGYGETGVGGAIDIMAGAAMRGSTLGSRGLTASQEEGGSLSLRSGSSEGGRSGSVLVSTAASGGHESTLDTSTLLGGPSTSTAANANGSPPDLMLMIVGL